MPAAAPMTIQQQIDRQGPIPWGDGLTPSQRKKKKAPTKFTTARKAKFLAHYQKTGLFMQSARAAGVAYNTAKRHFDNDAEFARLVDDAKDVFNESLEAEAIRRGTRGVTQPIYGQVAKEVPKADGSGMKIIKTMGRIGTKRIYSDTLLQFVMKKNMPEYRENMTVNQNVRGVMLSGEVPKAVMDEVAWGSTAKVVRPDGIEIDSGDSGRTVDRG